jgi:hypothetical protein
VPNKNSDKERGDEVRGSNGAAPRPRRPCESSPRLCRAMSVAHRPASVVYWAGIGLIIKTFQEAVVSRDH